MSRPFTYTWLAAVDNQYAIVGTPPIPDVPPAPPIAAAPYVLPANPGGAPVTIFLPINSNEPMGVAGGLSSQMTGAYIFQSVPPIDQGNANVYRNIAITSPVNLAAVSFTITGIACLATLIVGPPHTCTLTTPAGFPGPLNSPVVEGPLAGPNAGVVHNQYFYKKITSITATLPAAFAGGAVYIGFGNAGISNPLMLDISRTVYNTGAQVLVTNPDAGNCSLYQSVSDNARPENAWGTAPFYFNPWIGFDYPNIYQVQANILSTSPDPVKSLWFYFATNTTAIYNCTLIQQGIT